MMQTHLLWLVCSASSNPRDESFDSDSFLSCVLRIGSHERGAREAALGQLPAADRRPGERARETNPVHCRRFFFTA